MLLLSLTDDRMREIVQSHDDADDAPAPAPTPAPAPAPVRQDPARKANLNHIKGHFASLLERIESYELRALYVVLVGDPYRNCSLEQAALARFDEESISEEVWEAALDVLESVPDSSLFWALEK
jgi:hypothetical protein